MFALLNRAQFHYGGGGGATTKKRPTRLKQEKNRAKSKRLKRNILKKPKKLAQLKLKKITLAIAWILRK